MVMKTKRNPRLEKYYHMDVVVDTVREFFIFCNVQAGTRYIIAKFVWSKGVDASFRDISVALQVLKKNAEITFEKGAWFGINIK